MMKRPRLGTVHGRLQFVWGRRFSQWPRSIVWLASVALLLSSCALPPEATLQASVMDAFPMPPIRPMLGANPPQDDRKIILTSLEMAEQPIELGRSVLDKPIVAYRFGSGATGVVLVGGIHGSSEPNTVTLMEALIEMLQESAAMVPPALSLYIIPVMNPDGFALSGLSRRVNANQVDLNRNWDCRWQESAGLYRGAPYNAGIRAFSEPENQVVRNFVDVVNGQVVIFYHSHGAFIFYGDCNSNGGSLELARAVSQATGYPVWNPTHSLGDPEKPQITGDATDYFDRIGIASIGIELSTFNRDEIDWTQNVQGLMEILDFAASRF